MPEPKTSLTIGSGDRPILRVTSPVVCRPVVDELSRESDIEYLFSIGNPAGLKTERLVQWTEDLRTMAGARVGPGHSDGLCRLSIKASAFYF